MTVSNLDYLNRLKSVECKDSTYKPLTSPLIMARAKGSLIWDVEGREYIDLCAGFGALALGHASEALTAVTSSFSSSMPVIDHAMGDVYPSEEKILFLETLKAMLSGHYDSGAVALSGGQAVEIALKTAMLKTGKSGFIVFSNAYHGLDLGVLPLTAREDFRAPFKSWLAEERVRRLPYGAPRSTVSEAIASLEAIGLAAIVAEPIQGRAGVNLPPPGWLRMLADVSHENGGLLILDEVFTGFGRIGTVTSSIEADADISCFGKAIGGGFPISACFAKKHVMDAWPESPGEAIHTGTFFGHPFSAAVGRRTLERIQSERLYDRSRMLGQKAIDFLINELRHSPAVKSCRGQGLFIGIEFEVAGHGAVMMDRLRERGIIALPSGTEGQVLSVTPALNIPEDMFFRALRDIISTIKSV